ncbi:crotonyl-CoA carboxylase/reductase [Amycolatopsis saalfeldensis]|uniref:Crotonyl-CoA carboxylase/reductase n=1 Tax=Amycolatopsis saalfeldensis TaxID=394193 RepID=A0A1H8U039_9PSEU|nr:crotonyl-CoA carboxylase/reductase [Amycolatopsis saalfeldensis]SEO96620.1 crotonyl-CoA carboxylase/reductase [Amycolatopsis saalfeldensis]
MSTGRAENRTSVVTQGADPVPVGVLPPLGVVPPVMHAQVVRPARYGDPASAFVPEIVPTPELGPDEVLIAVMAAGINYNNVWAARGFPVDQVAVRQRRGEPEDFHVGGSDCAGIVYAVGAAVTNVEVGDHVVTHPGWWESGDPWIARGKDPMIAPSARIYGYDTNYGSFGQFTRVQSHQVLPKAAHLTWEEAAAPTLVGTTAYRMLHGWAGNTVARDDVVLVWGGSGGLGTQAIQLARLAGAVPVAVVSAPERGAYAEKFGAAGWIDRREFDHWGVPPLIDDTEGQRAWTAGARAFGKRIWDIAGDRRDPAIVFEHPGAATVPTSVFVCEPGGMVVICAGTTGYDAMVDLRYHWTRQKRLQGSHGTNDEQAIAYNRLVVDGKIDPALGRTIPLSAIPAAHAAMGRGEEVFGNVAALVGASEPGTGGEA